MNAALWLLLFGRGTYRAPPIADPIDWIGFTATGSVPACTASGDVSTLAAGGSRSLATCTGSASLAAASADIPIATITGRPYA